MHQYKKLNHNQNILKILVFGRCSCQDISYNVRLQRKLKLLHQLESNQRDTDGRAWF